MYCPFFGLNEPPFKNTPDLRLFYSGGKRDAVLDALIYAVTSGEGIVAVIGEVGSGKTMICRMLEARLPETVQTIYLSHPSLSRIDVLYALAQELGLSLETTQRAQMLRVLQDHLIASYSQGRQVVALIDEAQAMPLEALEEIRLLSNLETGERKLLQIVLFGQPELATHLAGPSVRQLRNRIAHVFHIDPLEMREIHEYLLFRLRAVGYRGPDIFSSRAVSLIAHASGGLLRQVNTLADKAMLVAFSRNEHGIEASHVKAAIRDGNWLPKFALRSWRIAALAVFFVFAVVLGVMLDRLWMHVVSYSSATKAPWSLEESAENALLADPEGTGINHAHGFFASFPYVVQLGAFRSEAEAKRLLADFQHISPMVQRIEVMHDEKPLHVVFTGAFFSQAEALHALQEFLKTEKQQAHVARIEQDGSISYPEERKKPNAPG